MIYFWIQIIVLVNVYTDLHDIINKLESIIRVFRVENLIW